MASSSALPGLGGGPLVAALRELDDISRDTAAWQRRVSMDLHATHQRLSAQIRALEGLVLGGGGGSINNNANVALNASSTANNNNNDGNGGAGGRNGTAPLDWEALATPSRSGGDGSAGADYPTPSMSSPPVHAGHGALSYDSLLEDGSGGGGGGGRRIGRGDGSDGSGIGARPTPESAQAAADAAFGHAKARLAANSAANALVGGPGGNGGAGQPCQVLVEFKRRRVLQFESPTYVAPGEYVVVGGDRGEDIGLVTHTWLAGTPSTAPESVTKWAGVGLGKVVRVASVLEVSQLQGVQTQLEVRAVEVAQEKVVEHQLPMRIVDAEYQFDRKKLTFYYQAQQRLDFRNLVRDLYKTFRARIWMEQD